MFVPKPHIKWDQTWGQYSCHAKEFHDVHGYAKTMREAYRRWYKLMLDKGYERRVS